MFKRRKPEEETTVSPNKAPGVSGNAAPIFPVRPTEASKAATTADASPTRSDISKDIPVMGRAPFPPSPSPATAPTPTPTAPTPVRGAAPGATGAAKAEVAERRTLVVGRGISVQGTVQDAERLVVEGTVEASMINAAELSVAPGGIFRGEVEVEDAELAGTIDGTLTARGSLVIRATGRLLGKAKCRRLQVEDGGQISGQLEMMTDPPARPSFGEAARPATPEKPNAAE